MAAVVYFPGPIGVPLKPVEFPGRTPRPESSLLSSLPCSILYENPEAVA
jgi:hypothetical protein